MLDVLKRLVKENLSERSELFVIHRETLEKINMKTTISALSTRLTTYLAPKALLPLELPFKTRATTRKQDPKKNKRESLKDRDLQVEPDEGLSRTEESTSVAGRGPLAREGVY